MPRHARGFDTTAAHAWLEKRDRRLGAWMRRLGPIGPDSRWRKPFDPVDALARAILYQQLSGKAAATIVGRVETAIEEPFSWVAAGSQIGIARATYRKQLARPLGQACL